MTRTMYDSVDLSQIPADAPMVAGYVDGHWPTAQLIPKRFPRARAVTITVLGQDLAAHVVDIETGDCTPISGVAWAKRKIAAGKGHPTLYCNTSTWPAVKAEVKRQGLDGKVSYWVAQYDGKAVIPAGAVAKQWTDRALGRNLDASVVADYWPGVDPAPKPKPATPVYVYRRTLRRGMVGIDVSSLKRRLKFLGYGGIFPGPVFGRGLDTAVRTFQRKHKLAVDGVVGPITAKAIG